MAGGVTKYNVVVSVIRKPPGSRNDFEVNELIPWFRKRSKLFESLKTEILFDVIKNVSFLTCRRDDVLIREGDKGDCMYIVLRGSVGVYRLHEDPSLASKTTDATTTTTTAAAAAAATTTAATTGDTAAVGPAQGSSSSSVTGVLETAATSGTTTTGSSSKRNESIRLSLGERVVEIGENCTFGDVALMSDDCIRTASVIVDEPSDFIVFDRDLYNRSVKFVLKKEFEDKTNFIAGNHYFRWWQPRYRKQLAMAMVKETVPFNSVLTKQGNSVDAICFVLSGEVKITVDPGQHKLQYPKLLHSSEFPADGTTVPDKSLSSPKQPAKSPGRRGGRGVRSSEAGQGKRHVTIDLCLLGINECIGDIEVLMDMSTYLQTAVCTQRTEVLVLEVRHFERLFVRRHPRTVDRMKEDLVYRLQCRMSPQIHASVPVLTRLLLALEGFRRTQTSQSAARRVRWLASRGPAAERGAPATPSSRTTIAGMFQGFVPQQGALVDIHGPGTVFHRIRARERIRLARLNKGRSVGWPGYGSVLNERRIRFGRWLLRDFTEDKTTEREDRTKDTAAEDGGRVSPAEFEVDSVVDPIMRSLEERMRTWHLSNKTHALNIRDRPLVATLHRTRTENLVKQASGLNSSKSRDRSRDVWPSSQLFSSVQRSSDKDHVLRRGGGHEDTGLGGQGVRRDHETKSKGKSRTDVIRVKAAGDKGALDFAGLAQFEIEVLQKGSSWV